MMNHAVNLLIASASVLSLEVHSAEEGAKHGWPDKQDDELQFLKWFDMHLLKK